MNEQIANIAERIKGLRELMDISAEEMASVTGTTLEQYLEHEAGQQDFSFTFLYNAAQRFHIDITELLTGELPKLSQFSLIRAGEGLPIERRKGFLYQHMAYLFKEKAAEPFKVVAKYDATTDLGTIELSRHEGQEFDFVLSGQLKVMIEEHEMILNPGDAIYYDSSRGHGMVATGGTDCEFLAVVIKVDGVKKHGTAQ